MGREVRMVPANWEHPTDENGDYIPLCMYPEGDCTHYMMYATTTGGTPISPALSTPEELAKWLADNNASAFGHMTATYEQWLEIIYSDDFLEA